MDASQDPSLQPDPEALEAQLFLEDFTDSCDNFGALIGIATRALSAHVDPTLLSDVLPLYLSEMVSRGMRYAADGSAVRSAQQMAETADQSDPRDFIPILDFPSMTDSSHGGQPW